MGPQIRAKICGLTNRDTIKAAADAGAAYLGFNFFPKSPRFVSFDDAHDLALSVPPGVAKVALVVDADNAQIDALLGRVTIDILQLHGEETPARVAEVKARSGLPVMKAIGVSGEDDLAAIDEFSAVADLLLVDAKAPKGADLPGGNGLPFDWRLIANRRWSVPWLLAGGLTAENVSEAVGLTGASQVDVSSGVETAPGQKDVALIKTFLAAL